MAKFTGKLGPMANWSYVYIGSRPREIIKIAQAVEADCKQFVGFSGKKQDGTPQDSFIVYWDSATAPTLEDDFDTAPIDTIIIAPRLTAAPKIYIRHAVSSPSVVGDWFGITAVAET